MGFIASSTASRGHLWVCEHCVAALQQKIDSNESESCMAQWWRAIGPFWQQTDHVPDETSRKWSRLSIHRRQAVERTLLNARQEHSKVDRPVQPGKRVWQGRRPIQVFTVTVPWKTAVLKRLVTDNQLFHIQARKW